MDRPETAFRISCQDMGIRRVCQQVAACPPADNNPEA